MITSFKQPVPRPSRTKSKSLILAALIVGALSPAWGQSIYTTGFEKPTFLAGSVLAGQDGWITPPPFSPNAAVITTNKSYVGRQNVEVLGSNLVPQGFINQATGGYYEAIGSYRHAVDYDTGGTKSVCISALVRVDGPKTGTGNNFFSASIAAIGVDANGDPSGIGELAISSDGHVYGYSSQDLVPVFLTNARVRLGEWHKLAIVEDFVARTYSFYVDEHWLGTFHFDASVTSNVLRRGSMIVYAAPDTTALGKEDYSAHFDNFSIKVASKNDHDHKDQKDQHDDDFDERD